MCLDSWSKRSHEDLTSFPVLLLYQRIHQHGYALHGNHQTLQGCFYSSNTKLSQICSAVSTTSTPAPDLDLCSGPIPESRPRGQCFVSLSCSLQKAGPSHAGDSSWQQDTGCVRLFSLSRIQSAERVFLQFFSPLAKGSHLETLNL